MDEPYDSAARGLRGWWSSPPRSGMDRLINPWEYRHLRLSGVARIAGGSVGGAAGGSCASPTEPTGGRPSSWLSRR